MSKFRWNSFVKSIKTIPVKPPEPKFKVNDIIINTKFKVISKVVEIRNIFEEEDQTINYSLAEYILEDVKNEAFENFMSKESSPEHYAHVMQNYKTTPRKRYKPCVKIDPYYDKVESGAAQILYGIRPIEQNKGQDND